MSGASGRRTVDEAETFQMTNIQHRTYNVEHRMKAHPEHITDNSVVSG